MNIPIIHTKKLRFLYFTELEVTSSRLCTHTEVGRERASKMELRIASAYPVATLCTVHPCCTTQTPPHFMKTAAAGVLLPKNQYQLEMSKIAAGCVLT